ncbi:MAG: phosphoenolpyruvate--protein phosphotransferase [Lachnospiraceae bacterium]|nr:phosphoenolpyruvate--protein phosphotransferase [Lachnospiraceae bacterium]
MKVAYGKHISVAGRIAEGRICFITEKQFRKSARPAEGYEAEAARFETARKKVILQQNTLYEEALAKAGQSVAEIFASHIAILHDETLIKSVHRQIARKKVNAINATLAAFRNLEKEMALSEDRMLSERAADVKDVANLLLDFLQEEEGDRNGAHEKEKPLRDKGPVILAAEDLTPSEVLRLSGENVQGIILKNGSGTSHAAILLRSMNLPTMIRCEAVSRSWDGKTAILDTAQDCVYIEPDAQIRKEMRGRKISARRKEALLSGLKDLPSETKSGRKIRILANIETPREAATALQNGAEGIGLLRTEFLFLNRDTYPDEEEQYRAYKAVLQAMRGKPVVIRTMDIGADKTPSYMDMEPERNPVLGLRAIRFCLTRPGLFKTQLRAILRAAAHGNAILLFPMITSLSEVKTCKKILRACERELKKEKKKYKMPALGIMVETPAAALCAEELAKEVSYLSIGTNDLLQYTCAVDRDNSRLDAFTNEAHPALRRLMQMTVDAGHRNHCTVSICGEIGADISFTEDFLKMGVDEISVHPAAVLPLRSAVRALD